MERFALWFLPELGRATLVLAAAGVVTLGLLKIARLQSPALHRAAWVATLLVGWMLVRLPVDVPWYEAAVIPEPAEVSEPAATLPADPPLAMAEIELAAPGGMTPEPLPQAGTPVELPPATVSVPLAVTARDNASTDSARTWAEVVPSITLAIWIAGMAGLVLKEAVGYLRFVRRLPASLAVADEWLDEWRSVQAEQAEQEGKTQIALHVTADVGPLVCRLPRGYVLLVPEGLWRSLDAAARRAILRHELAHCRRSDVWKSLGVRALALPHWFNPIAWLAVRRFDEAAEWACDEAASDREPTEYAKVLVHLGEVATGPGRFGAAMSGRPLAARVRRLLILSRGGDSRIKRATVVSLLLALLVTSVVRVQLVAQDAPPAATPTAEPSHIADEAAAAAADEKQNPARAAKQNMRDWAEKAYEAFVASYDAGTSTFDYVPYWSQRLMAAELELASSRAEQVAAAQAHLKRMQGHRDKVAALYKTGSRGGEANVMRAFEYYVAEAEAKLAEVEAAPERKVTQASPRPAPKAELPSPVDAPRKETAEVIDLEIKIAELEGQVKDRQLQLAQLRKADAAVPGTVSPLEIQRIANSVDTAVRQVKLHQKKLAETRTRPKQAAAAVGESSRSRGELGIIGSFTPAAHAGSRADGQSLRYDGKTFDDWAGELTGELSPVKRKEAMEALGQFAAHGYGRQAAEVIFSIMRNYSVWSYDGTSEGLFKQAAMSAAANVAADDLLPAVRRALETGNANERMFALRVLPLDAGKSQTVPLLVRLLDNPDRRIVELARAPLAVIDHDNPALVASIQRGLDSDSPEELHNALAHVRGFHYETPGQVNRPLRPYPNLIPSALSLLDGPHANQVFGVLATNRVPDDGFKAMVDAVAKGNSDQAEHARRLLEQTSKSQMETAPLPPRLDDERGYAN